MKHLFSKHPAAKAASAPADTKLRPHISAEDYGKLPAEVQAGYRPINPKYERMPVFCMVFYALALVSLGLYIAICNSVPFADWFNDTVSATMRTVLATLTSPIPFSLGELVIWLLPLALFLVLYHAIRRRCDSWRTVTVYVGMLLSVVALVFSLFVLTFTAGYRGSPLEDKLELDREKVSATELYDTAVILIDAINRETEEILFYTDDFSIMPYTFDEMNDKLMDAYEKFASEQEHISHTPSRVKPVVLSEALSYMHITGVYSFFTGEANVNVGFPDYTLPATAAHEMAHQRGVAREDEANFVSFLVCIGADDPYIRYSGYVSAYEYVASALAGADRELYSQAVAKLNGEVKAEMSAYGRFYDKYRESVASNISSTINNSYLQSQGTVGVKSYGMVVDLVVAYYKAAE